MQKDPLHTLLELMNHAVNQHPVLAPHLHRTTQQSLGETINPDVFEWASRLYAAPAPHIVKRQVFLRNNFSNATWIETGTFYGDTADFLSRHAMHVHTTEPEPVLFERAKQRFEHHNNVTVYNEISENFLPALLPTLSGNLCLWLDGHYSAGETFAGPNDTPLREELSAIRENIKRYDNIAVLIDDIRFCGRNHVYGTYPSLSELVSFADSLGLAWYVEHDIFIAKSEPKPMPSES
jgi:hypothetical protein